MSQQAAVKADSLQVITNTTTARKNTGKWLVPLAHLTAAGSSWYALGKSWYSEYPGTAFHTVNDWSHWRQMDKCGHLWSAYNIARFSALLWQKTGMGHRRSVWYAGITAFSYQSVIEIMDGFSSGWGFSWGDMGANAMGTLTYITQELLCGSQPVQIKIYTFIPVSYPAALKQRATGLFGHSYVNRLLNDYNAQTYWASINIASVLPGTRLPGWLNIGIGYGTGQMLGKTENKWQTNNETVIDYTNLPRYSRVLLSPDIDFTKIHTNHKWLRTLLYIANAIKIPAPALEYNSRGAFTFHALLLN